MFSQVTIIGNLTRDPEIRHTTSGMAVVDIGVAVNHREKQSGEWVDCVSFIDCTAFGRTAEVICEYNNKGSKVLIAGELRQDTWTASDGSKRSKVKVLINQFKMLSSKGGATGGQHSESTSEPATVGAGASDDDIPF